MSFDDISDEDLAKEYERRKTRATSSRGRRVREREFELTEDEFVQMFGINPPTGDTKPAPKSDPKSDPKPTEPKRGYFD